MYIVIEIQTDASGATAIPAPASYVDRADAEAKFHTVMAAAAKSAVAKHAAVMMNEYGTVINNGYYVHE